VSLSPEESSVSLDVDFELSEPAILELIEQGSAQYAVLLKCPRTHYRRVFCTKQVKLAENLGHGQLRGRIELFPFVIATNAVPDFFSSNFNSEYGGRHFDIETGCILAVEEPKFRFGDQPHRHFGSIFKFLVPEDMFIPPRSGLFDMTLNQDFVHILVKESDKKRVDAALNDPKFFAYVISAIVLPALIQVLSNLAHEHESYQDFDWYRSFQLRLEELGRDIENIEDSECLLIAQQILDGPMGRLSFPEI